MPHTHSFTHAAFPAAGLGTHSFCRNPGSTQATAWCFTVDPGQQRELCDVGAPSKYCHRWQLRREARAAAAADGSSSAATIRAEGESRRGRGPPQASDMDKRSQQRVYAAAAAGASAVLVLLITAVVAWRRRPSARACGLGTFMAFKAMQQPMS